MNTRGVTRRRKIGSTKDQVGIKDTGIPKELSRSGHRNSNRELAVQSGLICIVSELNT